jgi:hypothetical protein
MDDGLGRLRVPQNVCEAPHPLGLGGLQARIGQNTLEILMAVEPRQGVTEVHLRPTLTNVAAGLQLWTSAQGL